MERANTNRMNRFQTYSFKMFMMFSIMSVVAIVLIAYIIFSQVSDLMIEQEIKTNVQIVQKTTEYMEDKIAAAQVAISDIYYSDSDMQDVIDFMLNEEWDDHNINQNLINKQRFEGHFMSTLYSDADIVDIVLLSYSGEKAYIFSKKWSTVQIEDNPFTYAWIDDILSSPSPMTIIPSYIPTHIDDGPEHVYSVVASLFTSGGSKNHTGTILINYASEKIEEAYRIFEEDMKGDLLILDQRGNIVFDSSKTLYESTYLEYEKFGAAGDTVIDSEDVITWQKTDGEDFTALIRVTQAELYEDVRSLSTQVVFIIVMFVVILLTAFYFTSTFLVRRINLITNAIGKVQSGDLSARIPLGQNNRDELHSIAQMINSMCAELDDYINRTYLFELKLKENELIALQKQINPHFIYNTLEIIRVKALINNNHDVGNMINLLSNLFRRSMRSKDIVISIKEEIDYCRDYLELNQIRFLDRMKVSYDIDEDLNELGILKSVLQPLIENIIIHCIDGYSKMVEIAIIGRLKDDDVVITIRDTGKGMTEEMVAELNDMFRNSPVSIASEHIGMKNVSDRLKIVFGNDYGMSVDSQVDTMTEVTLRFPAMSTDGMIRLIGSEEGK